MAAWPPPASHHLHLQSSAPLHRAHERKEASRRWLESEPSRRRPQHRGARRLESLLQPFFTIGGGAQAVVVSLGHNYESCDLLLCGARHGTISDAAPRRVEEALKNLNGAQTHCLRPCDVMASLLSAFLII
nr:uncharacterized protein LOC127301161 isoform X1 [Lolium perenne]